MSDAVAVQAGLSRSGSTVAWQVMGDLLGAPVCKTHEWLDYGQLPIVLTVRNPFDAVASMRRVNPNGREIDIVCNTATEMVRFKKWHKGPMLVLKYEEWWPDLFNFVTILADFLKVDLQPDTIGSIVYKRNMTANRAIATQQGAWASHDPVTLIHGKHVGSGMPGTGKALAGSERLTVARVMDEFMHEFGYQI